MKKYFIIAAAALVMTACSNDENENIVQDDNVISLTAQVATPTRAANTAADLQDAALIYDSQTAANCTQVAVQVTDDATTGKVEYGLATYTTSASNGLTIATPQYYPSSGSTVSIYAYTPATAGTTFTVQADQSTAADYRASDLMYASKANCARGSSHELAFSHKLSKIVVTLASGTGSPYLSSANITLGTSTSGEGVNNQVTFAPATGEITEATGDQVITLATAAGTTAQAAVVVPQDMSGKKICVTIDGNTKSYEIPASTTFETGKVYSYTITVNKQALSVSSSVSNWGTGATVDNASLTF